MLLSGKAAQYDKTSNETARPHEAVSIRLQKTKSMLAASAEGERVDFDDSGRRRWQQRTRQRAVISSKRKGKVGAENWLGVACRAAT